MSRCVWLLFLTGCLTCLVGCGGERLEYTEVKRIDEKITPDELGTFFRIVDVLPDKKLPEFPSRFAPPPDWDATRTLPVDELVNEEEQKLIERGDVEWQSRHLQRNRPLQRALRREGMTPDQFVGLSLAIGVALGRSALRDDQPLEKIIEKGKPLIDELRKDGRPFSSLSREEMHHVLQQAIWITRVDRAVKLKAVPPENVALVRAHREKLERIFPAEFTGNPLDAVADSLEEQGLPFEELPESGRDDRLEWDPERALIGRDAPAEL